MTAPDAAPGTEPAAAGVPDRLLPSTVSAPGAADAAPAPADGTWTPALGDRYGRPPAPGRRRLARAALVVAAAAGVALVVWIGLGAAATPVRWSEVGYRVDGSTAVELTFDLTKDADATAVCRVQALSESYAEVGVQSVTVGPAGTQTQRVTTTIPTAEEAVTAVVESCDAG